LSEIKLLNTGSTIKELNYPTSTNNAPLWQKSLKGQVNLTRWHVKPRLNDALFAILRFFANCKAKKPEKKGYPVFKKHTRSVEYKTSGWALSADQRRLTFKDGFAAGTFKLIGSRDWHFYAR